MRDLIPEIPEQTELYRQLYGAMQGDIVGYIMRQYKGSDMVRFLHGEMKGHSLQVLPNILPNLYEVCKSVKEALEFEEPIDFYITGSSEVNAHAILSPDKDKPHVIEINSALFNLMSEDELKYIIGHEIGHLINRDGMLRELYYYIYPDGDKEETRAPQFLKSRFELWGRLAEFSADRYGYLACKNEEACVTAIFKLGSGLSLDKMGIRINDLLELNNRSLEYYLAENLAAGGTHPINPARIHALHLFFTAKKNKALQAGMDDLMTIIEGAYYSELELTIAKFFACAALYMRKDRGKLTKPEEDFVLNRMADYCYDPVRWMKQISKDDYMGMMHESLDRAMELNPNCLSELIGFLIDLAFVDDRIEPIECEKIFLVADQLGINPDLMYKAFTDKIRCDFKPLAILMS